MRFRRLIVFFTAAVVIITGFYIIQQYLQQYDSIFKNSLTVSTKEFESKILYIAVVACGQRFQETLVMIKSALLFNYPKDKLHFLIFVEGQETSQSFREKLDDWRRLKIPTDFDYSLYSLKFPPNSEGEWRNLFKPCAAQRLFLPSLLNNIDALLYVDTDILFLSPVSDIWKIFKRFNTTQLAALTPEHEDENVGWYNRFARHPFYGNLGINSGVMLMNLTRMREFHWEDKVLPIYKEYKLRITWGDQDIINILFYFHPERLFVMPCEYNFRPDHCMYMSVCNTSSVQGIKIMHGNRGYFHSNKQPLFKEIYEAIERYQLDTNAFRHFLQPLEEAVQDRSIYETTCGKVASDALYNAKQNFINDFNYND